MSILIGDAGGFANRASSEGLYDAFVTARNASIAIIENRPFREINNDVFEKIEKQTRFSRFLFAKPTYFILAWMCRFPKAYKWVFDKKLKN